MVPPEIQPSPGDWAVIVHVAHVDEEHALFRTVICGDLYVGTTWMNGVVFLEDGIDIHAEWLGRPSRGEGFALPRSWLMRITPDAHQFELEREREHA